MHQHYRNKQSIAEFCLWESGFSSLVKTESKAFFLIYYIVQLLSLEVSKIPVENN